MKHNKLRSTGINCRLAFQKVVDSLKGVEDDDVSSPVLQIYNIPLVRLETITSQQKLKVNKIATVYSFPLTVFLPWFTFRKLKVIPYDRQSCGTWWQRHVLP